MNILLVEDDETCRSIVGAVLRQHGHEVTAVSTGSQALALLGVGLEPDLLLTDIQLPGDLDGWSVAHVFKDCIPGLAVVYITGRPRDMDPVTNSIYLLKPVKPSLLMEAIEAIAPSRAADAQARVLH